MEGTAWVRWRLGSWLAERPGVAGVWASAAVRGIQKAQVVGWEVNHVMPSLLEDDIDPVSVSSNDLAVVVQPGAQRPMILINRDLLNSVAQGQGLAVSIMQRKVTQGTETAPGGAP